ncbi:hypothetical protein SO802_012001 [Lithocarpus litseifolius]|uniref:Uncharacterized protein n=1 Tax=Lithocarpus litseifolius TaxID=425828 RepID=A0AAW2D1J8_9ROSI
MAPKRKSVLSRNPLCSEASTSTDPAPSSVQFRDEDAQKDFSENFFKRGVHSERRVILANFADTDLHDVIHSRGWESLYSIVVTPKLVSDVLRVLRVEHPDYPDCERLRTMSKDEMISTFYERPSDWSEHQFILCRPFAKDVYKDTATRDKLIFPSVIMRIFSHFSIPFPSSDYFSVMCVIDTATVKHSEAQFRSRQTGSAAPPSHSASSRFALSTSAFSSFMGDVTLRDIMVQLQRMDARLDTLSTELYQVVMGGFALEASPPPPLVASDSDASDAGDVVDASNDDDDGDASSSDEMST